MITHMYTITHNPRCLSILSLSVTIVLPKILWNLRKTAEQNHSNFIPFLQKLGQGVTNSYSPRRLVGNTIAEEDDLGSRKIKFRFSSYCMFTKSITKVKFKKTRVI